jgi:uncharacterized protein
MTASAIYSGSVYHRRLSPRRHDFDHGVYFLYLDLDELPGLLVDTRLLDSSGLSSVHFRREDYLGPAEQPLKEAVLDRVEEQLGRRPVGPVRLLSQARVLRYVFNPVSFYYCFDEQQDLDAVVAEITNTPWGERHAYVIDSEDLQEGALLRSQFHKEFHVSPFFDMDQVYDWRFSTPDEHLEVHMSNLESSKAVFHAGMTCERSALTAENLRLALRRHPLQPQRVSLAIYFQAARLWLKRMPFFVHPSKRPLSDTKPKVIPADANPS